MDQTFGEKMSETTSTPALTRPLGKKKYKKKVGSDLYEECRTAKVSLALSSGQLEILARSKALIAKVVLNKKLIPRRFAQLAFKRVAALSLSRGVSSRSLSASRNKAIPG
jgi:hypothetical protein